MAARFSFGNIHFDLSPGEAMGAPQDPEAPFGLAVLGDFTGRASRSAVEPLDQGRVWKIDCDNFDEVMRRLEVRLRVPLSGAEAKTVELRFENMEDFHPDHFLKQVKPLAALSQQRARLLQPATATEATAELQARLTSAGTAASPVQSPAAAESDADALARLLGGAPKPAAQPAAGGAPGLEHLIQNLVAPSVVPGTSAQQMALLATVDLELGAQVRSLLHDPSFQALEATWRGLDLLVRNFGGEENLRIFLFDVSKAELSADLHAAENLAATRYGKLLRNGAETQSWAVCLGLFTFEPRPADFEVLGRLARVCAGLGVPFVSGAGPHWVGCDSLHIHPDPEDWKIPLPAEASEACIALRAMPESCWLGLALPRFLLRQPYGKESGSLESFPFEECPAEPVHESYLWGNPAVVCGYLLAEAFQAQGWEMRANGYGELGDLPVHKFKRDGETEVTPCAEAWLTERAAEAILAKGPMALLSIKGRDAVRLPRMQSLHSPASGLKGRWG